MTSTLLKWWAYKEEWGKAEGTKEAIINSVRILNYKERETKSIKPCEDFIVKAEFTVNEKVREPHFGIAIFREDGVYCYGPNTLFDGYKMDYLNKDSGWFSIRYKAIPLLPSNYRLSVAIWDKKEILAYNYHSGLYKFKISGRNINNQLFNMKSVWNDNVQIKSSNYDDILCLRALKNFWRERTRLQNNIDIKGTEILDTNDKPKSHFKTNETLKLRIHLAGALSSDYLLWVGIFREDGIYCHGAFRKLEPSKKEVALIYPEILLLDGNYLISAGLFDIRKKRVITCNHGIYPFKILSDLKDHGTVYCEHEWKWELP